MKEPGPPTADEVLFEAVRLPVEEREAFLAEACAGRPELAAEVSALLAVVEDAQGFLESPALDLASGLPFGPEGELEPGPAIGDLRDPGRESQGLQGKRVGAYRLGRLLGSGGMGTVYLGERADGEFDKKVAIKLIRPGLGIEEIQRRFRTERQALAGLEHPHIARLLDGGTEDGRPFLVMEYVDGEPIDRSCDRRRLSIGERLKLFLEVCAAVEHAHRNLVVHRDLKPGNILVDGDGQVKLLDFGIAKILEGDGEGAAATTLGSQAMTPTYASPEQLKGERVSTATDVYSLGVVLFELLCGRPPFSQEGPIPSRAQLEAREGALTRPSAAIAGAGAAVAEARREGSPERLARRLRGDLDKILLKALRSEPERRYRSVEGLAEDLRRHLGGRPVSARPDSLGYRISRFVRRNAAAVAAALAAVLTLVAATAVSTTLYLRAQREGSRAEEVSTFLQGMLSSVDPAVARGRDVTLLRELLDASAVRVGEIEDPRVRAELLLTLGRTYLAIAENDEALLHLRAALELREGILPESDPGISEAERQIGRALYAGGRYDEAREHLAEAVAAARDRGVGEGVLLGLIHELATVEEALAARQGAAEGLYRDALDLAWKTFGEEHRATAEARNNLGNYLLNHGDLGEAEELLQAALPTFRRDPDDCLICLADTLHNLASVRRRRGDYAEAEALLREALEILEGGWEEHPRIARTIVQLGTVLELEGDLEGAERNFRRALGMQRELLGDDHPHVGVTTNNLGILLDKRGRYDESVAVLQEAIDIYRRSIGAEHAWVAIAHANLAAAHLARGDCPAALAAAAEHRRIGLAHWPEDHWRIVTGEGVRGRCLVEMGRREEGLRLLEAVVEALERRHGASHPKALQARERLAAVAGASGP